MAKSIKILAIGNSFSDNAMAYLHPILRALGYDNVVLGNLFIGGCPLATHTYNALNNLSAYTYRKNTSGQFVNVENVSIATALADEDWQFVTMQQASGVSGVESTYDYATLKNYVLESFDYDVSLLWHFTWAYQQDSDHPEFANYNFSQRQMYDSILRCVQNRIAHDSGFQGIIPVGTAIQNARTSYLGDTLTADGFHLDGLGEFIAGLMWAATITHCNLQALNVTMLPQQFVHFLPVAVESVNNALANPFAVTASQYTVDGDSLCNYFEVTVTSDVSYADYSRECKLDVYFPQKCSNYVTLVHFHGGGFTSGDKSDFYPIACEVARHGVAVVSVNYRLFPNAKIGDYYVDAANAIRYVRDNVALNGNGAIYVSGQSAGANIALMLAFNGRYLTDVGIKPADVSGWVIESGQPTVHFETLRQCGQDSNLEIVDERAPLYYVGSQTQFNKMLLIAYTDDILKRLSQNELLYKTLRRSCPHEQTELRVLYGQHCVSSTAPCHGKFAYTDILLNFLQNK